MKKLYIFKDGTMLLGNPQALVLSQHPSNIKKEIDVDGKTDKEIEAIKQKELKVD